MVSHTRVQAHLAHLIDVLDGNVIDEPDPPPGSLDVSETDLMVEAEACPPTITALLFTPAVPSSSVAVDTSFVNDNFCFEGYTLSEHEHKGSCAFSTLPNCQDLPGLESCTIPVTLTASTLPFNSLFNSGCTNHIFRES